MDRKKGLIQKLVVGSRHNETGYIMRALQGKLRIGLAEQTVLVALAHAVLLHRQGDPDKDGKLAGQLEEAAQAVKYVYSQCPSYDQLVPALLNHPVSVSPLSMPFPPSCWQGPLAVRHHLVPILPDSVILARHT